MTEADSKRLSEIEHAIEADRITTRDALWLLNKVRELDKRIAYRSLNEADKKVRT